MVSAARKSFRPFEDAPLPTLRAALDPAIAGPALAERLRGIVPASATLRSIEIRAYKPGRRCLIEYQLDVPQPDGAIETISLLGKIRANRFGNSGYRLQRALWKAGFDYHSPDGISVPEPIGTVPDLRMWLQQKVAGASATDVLGGPGGVELAGRIARAVHKLHTSNVAADKRHTMDDELLILVRCLTTVAALHRELASRIHRVIDHCVQVGGLLPSPQWCSSHRDFYSDQVIVGSDRLYLVDFDLFCAADPGLDVGNFLGHVTEYALRARGDANALSAIEERLEDEFVALAGEHVRFPLRAYTALTLARHVFLSTQFPDRSRLTLDLLALAEERLQRVAAEGAGS